jgi:predicted permease
MQFRPWGSGRFMPSIRYALRQLRKSPGFSLTVIITIALGIGANTAIFTLVHAVLMKSLPVVNPKTLYRLGDKDDCCVNGGFINDDGDFDLFSYELYRTFRDNTPEFEQLAAMQSGNNGYIVRRPPEPGKSLSTEYVSGNYFSTFGIGAFAGRVLNDGDDTPSSAPVVVLSYDSWQSEFGGDLSIIGSTLYLEGKPVTVVGIAPKGFFGDRIRARPPALWIPLNLEQSIDGVNANLKVPDSNWLYAVGRLKAGVSIGPLQEKVTNTLQLFFAQQEAYTKNGRNTLIPKQHVVITPAGGGIQNLQQQTSKGLYLLMTLSGLLLLIACANVANLLLARGATRRAETSVRMALGAARGALIKQMLTESVLLSCLGGLAGLAVAYAGTRTILALAFPRAVHLPIESSPSLPVLGFAFLLSLITGIMFGIVPAWITSHSDPAEALRGVNRSTADHASLPQKSLIVVQAALSLILLIGAGLLTRSLNNLQHQNFGIQTTNRYVVHIDPAAEGYSTEKLPALYQALEQRFASVPGVQSAGLGLYSVLEGNNWGESIWVEGRPDPAPNENHNSSWDRVSPQFFDAVGQPVVRGRGFTDADTANSQMVAVVNQRFVKKFFPNEDPIGRHFGIFQHKFAGSFEIVGIVADAKYSDPHSELRPMYFRPVTQQLKGLEDPNEIQAENRSMYINSITLRFRGQPQNVDQMVRTTLADIDPNIAIIDLRSLDSQISQNLGQEHLIARLTMLFGLLALVLASVGLYGITSYAVARRTNEIGLRMALGADRGRVLRLVLRGAFAQVGLGLAIGIPVALVAGRLVADQLFNVRPYDPVSLALAVAVLSVAAAIAGFIPAARAASIEPMQALRTE